MNSGFVRLVAFLVLVTTALFFPWWVFCAAAVLFVLYFPSYFEVLFVGAYMDSIYGHVSTEGSFFAAPVYFTLFSFAILVVSHYFKRRLNLSQS